MLWLLQNNYVDQMTGRLAWALQRTGRPLFDFSLIPGEPLPAFPCVPQDPHFCYGSTGLLKRLQREPAWAPGLFNDELALDQRHWRAHLNEALLNPRFEVMPFAQLRHAGPPPPFFVRPVEDQKAFAGQVLATADLAPLYRARKGQWRPIADDLLVAVSPVVPAIAAEYRCVVLNGEVRLISRYRLNGELSLSAAIPTDVWATCQAWAEGWLPASFIVMDIALLASGESRIIEFNSVHTSGLYAIAGEAFAEVVEDAVRQRAGSPGHEKPAPERRLKSVN